MVRLVKIPLLAALGSICLVSAAIALPPPPPPPPPGPPPPHVQFGITFGGGDYGDQEDDCLSPHEIYTDLHDDGYRYLHVVSDDDDTLVYDARLGTRSYELTVDACSGEIISRHRIYHY